jgi:hypothetical protein
MGYEGLHNTLRRRAKHAGIEGIHPHRLRHTAARRWLAMGRSEAGLMAIAGWSRTNNAGTPHLRPRLRTRRGRGPAAGHRGRQQPDRQSRETARLSWSGGARCPWLRGQEPNAEPASGWRPNALRRRVGVPHHRCAVMGASWSLDRTEAEPAVPPWISRRGGASMEGCAYRR